MAAVDFTTLTDVKSWLGVKNAENDEVLSRLITAASSSISQVINRDIAATNYVITTHGNGKDTLPTPSYPILSVTVLKIDGVLIQPSSSYNAPGYTFDDTTVYLRGGAKFTKDRNNVEITYRAGFEIIPFELQQACIETVAARWRERDRIGLSSKGLAGETTAFDLKDFPSQVKTILANFKKVIPV